MSKLAVSRLNLVVFISKVLFLNCI
jgi:hypothetical protein